MTFRTPEEAALNSMDGRCPILASSVGSNAAYFLFDGGTETYRYLYGVNVVRYGGGWTEGSSGNGSGWSQASADPELGTWTLWDDAPDGADRVRARLGGDIQERPVEHATFLFAWFEQPYDPAAELLDFRIHGHWIAADEVIPFLPVLSKLNSMELTFPDSRRLISSGSTFETEIGYSRAVVDGEWVFVSGTTGFDYATMTISDDVVAQAAQCLKNIEAALTEAGATFADVVRVRYILPNAADFPACWPTLRKYFGDVPPAATMIAAGLADARMKIEIEVTARKSAFR